jgi:hypothetical protein
MPAPPVYADECVDRPLIDGLRARGFDVLTAVEAGKGGEVDAAHLDYASSLDRILLSHNRRDFRRLHRSSISAGREHAGIVLVPQATMLARRVLRLSMLLDWIGTSDDSGRHSRLIQWNDLQLLLHAGVRLPGYSEDEVKEVLGQT